ncbi:TetR/AcrR family transcriptional regulator [Brevibacillus borstelensis]|uniref:TetR/AcrR family transcriptional regulator n=1 Tax=Brevibacillus borstelensis TaxID=45462 RepID=UPI0030BD491D
MARSKKDQIVEGALMAFAQYGYSDTTMDAIADVAEVAKGTLYYHFSTKEELFLYVIEKGVKMLIDSVDSVMQREDLSMDQRVLCVLDEHLRFFSENRELCLLLLSFFTGDQQRDEMIGKLLSGYFTTMEAYVAELQREGFVRPDIEVRTMVSSLFGMAGFTMLRKQFRKETGITDADKRTLHLLLSGVLTKG